MRKKVSFLH